VGQDDETLDGIELFENFSVRDLKAVAKRCHWRQYTADQQIVGHLDQTRDVFFIVESSVRAVIYSPAGKEISFRDISAGDMFGEFSAIDGQPRSAHVIALTDSLIASLSADEFWQVLRDYPIVAEATLKRLTKQLRILSERVFEFSALTVKNRIHAELLRLARDHSRGANKAAISPVPTHAEIASRVSTHREAVTRELNDLTRAGLIERRHGVLIIRDVEHLARMVEEVRGQ
jgi:CRP-like cAMP-binding protein